MQNQPWTLKYLPRKVSEVVGQEGCIDQLRKWLAGFKRGKGLLIHGPSGIGKTTSVYALASELGYELLEINASDTRNADAINDVAGQATKQASLFFRSKIILIDEVEGLSGREDRGGVSALVSIIESSAFPIIIIATDPYADKLSPLRKKCSLLEYKTLPTDEVAKLLERICKTEGLGYEPEALREISLRAGGDLRAAINDLQSSGSGKITRYSISYLGERERTQSIISALIKVFKTTDPQISRGAYDDVDEDLEKIFLWVDENLPKEYSKPQDLARGFEALSQADVFKGRILRWQHYRFYVYCYDLLSTGIALAKDEKYRTSPEYKPTSRILKIWIANQKNLKKKAIAEKIASKTHRSKKKEFQETLPYLKMMFKDKKQAERLAEYFDLDGEQEAYLKS